MRLRSVSPLYAAMLSSLHTPWMQTGVPPPRGSHLFLLDTMRAAGFGYLLHRGEENQHAHCCQHAAVYLTDGRSDEPADDEQEADGEGYV